MIYKFVNSSPVKTRLNLNVIINIHYRSFIIIAMLLFTSIFALFLFHTISSSDDEEHVNSGRKSIVVQPKIEPIHLALVLGSDPVLQMEINALRFKISETLLVYRFSPSTPRELNIDAADEDPHLFLNSQYQTAVLDEFKNKITPAFMKIITHIHPDILHIYIVGHGIIRGLFTRKYIGVLNTVISSKTAGCMIAETFKTFAGAELKHVNVVLFPCYAASCDHMVFPDGSRFQQQLREELFQNNKPAIYDTKFTYSGDVDVVSPSPAIDIYQQLCIENIRSGTQAEIRVEASNGVTYIKRSIFYKKYFGNTFQSNAHLADSWDLLNARGWDLHQENQGGSDSDSSFTFVTDDHLIPLGQSDSIDTISDETIAESYSNDLDTRTYPFKKVVLIQRPKSLVDIANTLHQYSMKHIYAHIHSAAEDISTMYRSDQKTLEYNMEKIMMTLDSIEYKLTVHTVSHERASESINYFSHSKDFSALFEYYIALLGQASPQILVERMFLEDFFDDHQEAINDEQRDRLIMERKRIQLNDELAEIESRLKRNSADLAKKQAIYNELKILGIHPSKKPAPPAPGKDRIIKLSSLEVTKKLEPIAIAKTTYERYLVLKDDMSKNEHSRARYAKFAEALKQRIDAVEGTRMAVVEVDIEKFFTLSEAANYMDAIDTEKNNLQKKIDRLVVRKTQLQKSVVIRAKLLADTSDMAQYIERARQQVAENRVKSIELQARLRDFIQNKIDPMSNVPSDATAPKEPLKKIFAGYLQKHAMELDGGIHKGESRLEHILSSVDDVLSGACAARNIN